MEKLVMSIALAIFGGGIAFDATRYLRAEFSIIALGFFCVGMIMAGLGMKVALEEIWGKLQLKNPAFYDLPPIEEIDFLHKRAYEDDADAQEKLGVIYEAGHGVKKDAKEAFRWTQSAAIGGNKHAQYRMGTIYQGYPQDLDLSLEWHHKAADQGFALACFALADMYQYICLPKDIEKAKKWYYRGVEIIENGANAGGSEDQNAYGALHMGLFEHPQDYCKAMIWLRKAAAQGEADAMNNIGALYMQGYGVEKDQKQAIEWYCKAVKAGGKRFLYQYDFWTHLKIRIASNFDGVIRDAALNARMPTLSDIKSKIKGDQSMFCRNCGNQMPDHATVCDSCNTRTREAVFCHRCAAELPANTTRCTNCNAKSRAHKSAIHWIPLVLTVVAFLFYALGGYYYFDYGLGAHNYSLPYATVLDYLALAMAAIALIISIAVIPRTRLVIKIISVILSLIMVYLAIEWILYAVL